MNGAIYVSDSGNTKIMGSEKVDATYTSIQASCPNTCSLMGEGCYAQSSYVGMTSHRLDDEASDLTPLQVARAEAKAIKQSYGGKAVPPGRSLRLHVSGDSRTVKGSRIIDRAVGKWKARGGGDCWSYTHAWQHVHRFTWTHVSMLASVSSVEEAKQARENWYAPAIVVDEHPSEKAYKLPNSDVKWIPCPAQTRGVGCTDCRLCFNDERLYEQNMGIAFAAHGVKKESVKRHLKLIK